MVFLGCKYKPFSGKVDQIKTLHSEDDHFVKVTWKSGKQSRFPYIFLRENCKCPSCFHPQVKQRLVVVYNEKSVADSITIKDNGNYLECCWSDGHVSYYSAKWLNHRCFVEKSDKVKSYEETSILKDGCELLSAEYNLREMAYDYEAIMSDDKSLLHWSYDLHCRGLTLIQNAPAKEGVLFKLAERVGHYKLTVHGYGT